MAQPTSAWTFSDYFNAVGERVFNSAAAVATQRATCKRFVNEGYQKFIQSYEWGFMYPTASLEFSADDTEKTLPENFGAIRGKVSRSAASYYEGLTEVAPDEIRRRRAFDDTSAIPSFYALSPVTFVAGTGQTWEMQIYPKTNANITIAFQYRVMAALLSADADYPLGGALHSLTILHAAYAVWEQEKDATQSIQEAQFQTSLQNSIRIDNDLRPVIVDAGRTKRIYSEIVNIDGVE